jgi:hypothetical protein
LIPSLLRGNQMDANVSTLSGILEQARETATANNTYVWVAFTDPPSASSPVGIYVATIQSIDGTESPINTTVTPSWATIATIPGTNLNLLGKIQNLPGVTIVDNNNAALPAAMLAAAPPAASAQNLFETSMQWTVTPLQYTSLGTGHYFTHAIEFTPDGEAHVPTWSSNIQFGLTPSLGTASSNPVLFNVSRLTGKTTVYRQ